MSRKNMVTEALEQAMSEQSFSSLQEAQAFVESFMFGYNNKPVADFHGLSPNDIRCVLEAPFDSPDFVVYKKQVPLEDTSNSPIMFLLLKLTDAIGSQGLKPTAKGNLPRNVCREIAQQYRSLFKLSPYNYEFKVNSETDIFELHVVRLVAELAGYIRKYKGKFILSKKFKTLLNKNNGSGLYPDFLQCYIQKFNWAYCDGYAEVPRVQSSFLFTIYLLMKYGDKVRSVEFYADHFIKAFPAIIHEIPENEFTVKGKEQELKQMYILRCLTRFTAFTGLGTLKFKPSSDKTAYIDNSLTYILNTKLLHSCWQFV